MVGAKFGVMADLFRDFSNIITIGLRKEATPTVHLDERYVISIIRTSPNVALTMYNIESRYHDLWEVLKKYYPDIITRIASGGDIAVPTTVLLVWLHKLSAMWY